MALYKYLQQAFHEHDTETVRKRMIEWRAGEAFVRVERPLNLARAHMLGYKAKKGIIVVRARLIRGGRTRHKPRKGRRSKRQTIKKVLKMNYREVAEQRVARKYPNMEVINSYQIGKDGRYYFFEVILADRNSPELKNDKQIGPIISSPQARVFRGLTSSGVKARGLRNSAFKVPKVRPSLRAHDRKGN